MARIPLTTIQSTGIAFYGLYGSTAPLATKRTHLAANNCIGIGFQRGTHTRWQLVANDASGEPTLTIMGASVAFVTCGALPLCIAAPPNGGSVCMHSQHDWRGCGVGTPAAIERFLDEHKEPPIPPFGRFSRSRGDRVSRGVT